MVRDTTIPVYQRDLFTPGCGLYTGGGLILPRWSHDNRIFWLVIRDDRRDGYFRLMGGGQTEIDQSPAETAQRELGEELFVSRDRSGGTRILPALGYVPSMIPLANHLFSCDSLSLEGTQEQQLIITNKEECQVEHILQWTLPEIAVYRLIVLHEENYSSGGQMGGVVFTLNPTTRKIVGMFNGMQGFMSFDITTPIRLHTSLEQLLSLQQ